MLPVLAALQLLLIGAPPVTRAPSLHVSIESDGALPCAANLALRTAISLRLPSVRLSALRPEPDDLLASLSKVGTVWWFEVRRPSGALAMSRALMTDSDCPQLADTAALILERYMADIDWRGRPMGIELPPAPTPLGELLPRGVSAKTPAEPAPPRKNPIPAPRSEVASTPEFPAKAPVALSSTGVSGTQLTQGESGFEARDVAVTTRTSVTTPALPPPETPKPEEPVLPVVTEPPAPEPEPSPPPQPGPQIFSHWAVSVGGGGWFSIPTDVTASLSLEVATLLLERVRLSLLFAGGSAMSRDLQSRGSLSAQAFVGLATATICAGQRFSGCGGLAAGAQLTTGAIASTPASGQHLYRPSDQLIALPVLGLHGRLALTIAGPVELALDLSALAPLGSGSFAIEGFTTPAYTTPPVELISGLRLGWTFY